jgi:hypothetical protein
MFDIKTAQAGFFDRRKVLIAAGKARVRALGTIGRLVRKQAQASLVYSDDVSPPGKPPHAHKSRKITKISKKTGKPRTRSVSFLREYLYYSYDHSSESVVIGPAKLNRVVSSTAPEALEHGGASTIINRGKRQTVQVKAHPFMAPALEAERPGFAHLWKDSIR